MIELANDVVIRCESCGEIIYRQRELYDPSESYYERDMGTECIAEIRDEVECPNCGNAISFELRASSYAYDIHNERPVIEGGGFLEQPFMQLIEENGEWDFYRWAYDEADDVRRLILDSAQSRDYMYNLHPRDFELMVERIFIMEERTSLLENISVQGYRLSFTLNVKGLARTMLSEGPLSVASTG